ncbi:MAG TPA: hypothetical protein VH186_00740 [Chloroflexia bacterium]|nr:hypothetical protein [Chloroflexia bacterium]
MKSSLKGLLLQSRKFPAYAALAILSGSFLLLLSLIAKLTIHPLTPRISGSFHIVGMVACGLMLWGLPGLILPAEKSRGGLARTAFLVAMAGFAFLLAGDFIYAFFHSLLGVITIVSWLHEVPLFLARLLLAGGSFLYGLALLGREKSKREYLAASLLMLGAIIFISGWEITGGDLYYTHSYTRYLKALIIVGPICLGWGWLSFIHLTRQFLHYSRL